MSKKELNRRISARYELNVMGTITIIVDGNTFSEPINIVNVSYEGLQAVFADNDFLFETLMLVGEPESMVTIKFEYNDKFYVFDQIINWLKLYKIGERHYYVLTGFNFKDKAKIEEVLIELLLELQMREVYFG